MGRKRWIIILCAVLCIVVFNACSGQPEPIPYDDLSDLSAAVGFTVVDPIALPDGYALAGYYAVGNNLAEIVYVNGSNELIFAMTSQKKVESDFGNPDETKAIDVNGVSYELSMDGDSVHLAVARTGGYSYAIYSKTGVTEQEITDMAGSIGLKNQ